MVLASYILLLGIQIGQLMNQLMISQLIELLLP